MLKIKIKKLVDNAIAPVRGSVQAAGCDLYSTEPVTIPEGETKLVHTGLSMEIPDGYFGAIYARSGLATKQGLRPANCVGVIDSDYRGPIMVALHNDSNECQYLDAGTRVAQIIIQKHEPVFYVEEDDLTETERGDKGFGSSGDKEVTWSTY